MRRLVLLAAPILLVGCAAPGSDGGLWARQGLQQELTISRLTEQQRKEMAREFELRLADEALDKAEARIVAALQACRGAPEPASPDLSLNALRIRVGDDLPRRVRLTQLAMAESLLAEQQCERARTALTESPAPLEPLP